MTAQKLKESFDVIIIGGGFCGVHVAKILDKMLAKDFTLAFFDKKDYFEYTPSVHKVISDKNYHDKIVVPFQNLFKRTAIFSEEVTAVTPAHVQTNKGTYSFKYLVVSLGIAYPIFIEDKKNTFTLKNGEEAKKIHEALQKSKNVVIVGGGLIGTEIAGELVTKMKDKNVTVIEPSERILIRNPPGASAWAARFLTNRGCSIVYGEKVVEQKNRAIITDKGSRIPADIILWCAGIKCDTGFLANDLLKSTNERKCIIVNDNLQIEGLKNIFCGGDLNNIQEEKTAHNAEHHAKIIAHNILAAMEKHKSFLNYTPSSAPLVISLGDYAALFTFKNFWWGGIIPAIVKKMIEVGIMLRTKYF